MDKHIYNDLNIPTNKEENVNFSSPYLNQLSHHWNLLAIGLFEDSKENNRLKRYNNLDLKSNKQLRVCIYY